MTLEMKLEEMHEDGLEEGRKEGRKEGLLVSIRNLMHTAHLTSTEAMNALLIPPEQQEQMELLL